MVLWIHNRQWRDNFYKDMPLFMLDSTQMGQTSTRVPESSLLPGLSSKMCPLQSLLPTGNRFESLGMVPISSPMAWGGNQFKSYSIVSFSGKSSSHGKGCSCVVLPPSAIVFMFRLRGEWVFFNPIFSFHMRW